jgi:hypothetical protein
MEYMIRTDQAGQTGDGVFLVGVWAELFVLQKCFLISGMCYGIVLCFTDALRPVILVVGRGDGKIGAIIHMVSPV